MKAKGLFITFEGGEGAGKSTLINALHKKLKAEGHNVIQTREPGGSKIGAKIRTIILDPEHDDLCPRAELFLYLADRAQHVDEVILPALDEGKIILCDRHNDSTLAYQAVGRGLLDKQVRPLCEFAVGPLKPHRTFFLDIDPEKGLARTTGQFDGKKDRLENEKIEFHRRIRSAFLQLAEKEPGRFQLLDAEKSAETVLSECYEVLHALL